MFDRKTIRFRHLSERKHKIYADDLRLLDFEMFIPEYENPDLDVLAERIIKARKNGKPVIWMMGAHVIRRGNSRFIIDLMKKKIITHLAVNGACAIHDFEMALLGATCEDVEQYIKDGQFGNWEETGRYINYAVISGFRDMIGFGKAIARMIASGIARWPNEASYDKIKLPYNDISIFAAAYWLNIPITVHKSIGQDITDQHPAADYAAIGGASGQDFLIFTDSISKLEGGVFLTLGTQVMGPEVYLKALSMARNAASQENREIRHFTTAVFDIADLGDWRKEDDSLSPTYYFRPKKTILIRTIKDGGESFYIQGDFAVTVPNLYKRIIGRSFEK